MPAKSEVLDQRPPEQLSPETEVVMELEYTIADAALLMGISKTALDTWMKHRLITVVNRGFSKGITGLMIVRGRKLAEYAQTVFNTTGKKATTDDLRSYAPTIIG